MSDSPDSPAAGTDETEDKLALPSLSFGRRRKKTQTAQEAGDASTATAPVRNEPEPVRTSTPPERSRETATTPSLLKTTAPAARATRKPDLPPPPAARPPAAGDEHPSEPARKRSNPMAGLPPAGLVAVVGALTGGIGFVLGFVLLRGCEVVRGTETCGGLGVLALLILAVVQILLGALLLRVSGLPDATSIAFLGVILAGVLVLLLFLGVLGSIASVVVLPALTALTFLASWWVTTNATGATNDYTR